MTRVGFTAEDLADNTVRQEQKTTSANKKQSKQSKKPAEVSDAADSYTRLLQRRFLRRV